MRFRTHHPAFSLLEMLIVVAIIALIAVLATPEVMRAQVRGKAASETENLRMIQAAKAQFSAENPGVQLSALGQLLPYFPDGKLPVSPWGVTYNMTEVLDRAAGRERVQRHRGPGICLRGQAGCSHLERAGDFRFRFELRVALGFRVRFGFWVWFRVGAVGFRVGFRFRRCCGLPQWLASKSSCDGKYAG